MGGGDHHHKVVVPDYRIYKVENVPELVKIRDALAEKGLKDPWLRNEVWRYNPEFGTKSSRMRNIFTRGFKYGFGAFVASLAVEYAYRAVVPPEDHHHGEHH